MWLLVRQGLSRCLVFATQPPPSFRIAPPPAPRLTPHDERRNCASSTGGYHRCAGRSGRLARARLARNRAGALVAADGHRCAVRRRQRCAAGDRAGNSAAARDPGIGHRCHTRTVRRGTAGPAAQSAGVALAVRRTAIRRVRRGADHRAGFCGCAILGAAGGGDRGGVRARCSCC